MRSRRFWMAAALLAVPLAGCGSASDDLKEQFETRNAEARALVHAEGCASAASCAAAALGAKACGGAREYLVYCRTTTDETKLLATLDEAKRAEQRYNELTNAVGLFSGPAAGELHPQGRKVHGGHPMRRTIVVTVLAAGLAAAGCNNPTESRLDTLDANRAKFTALIGANYTFVMQRSCFCVDEVREPALVTVRGGAIVGVTRVATGAPAAAEGYKTVAELFDYLEHALQGRRSGNVAEVRVSFDAQYGYPNDIWVDESFQIADEEQGFTLSDLQPVK
jgi:hypothetical protein